MGKGLIEKIVFDLDSMGREILLIENPDDFLYREDIKAALKTFGFAVIDGERFYQRLVYELKDTLYPGTKLILLSKDNGEYLEDIQLKAAALSFHLDQYLGEYHIEAILDAPIDALEKLYLNKPYHNFSKKETVDTLEEISKVKSQLKPFDFSRFEDQLQSLLNEERRDWFPVLNHISRAILDSLHTPEIQKVLETAEKANIIFQKHLDSKFKALVNSNALKKPQVVSKVLDHLNYKEREEKIALLVLDGLSFWQYLILKKEFPDQFQIEEQAIYSWIPSITQLSRQAIFKGGAPDFEYVQNPRNEENLWRSYWKEKGFGDYHVGYQHNEIALDNFPLYTRLALVFTELDDKMHGSTDYNDLEGLTKSWMNRSNIIDAIQQLIDHKFTVYLTTDHGNIQAKGWRNLVGKEKLGTSRSRSKRHLEYAEEWIAEDFLEKNSEIANWVVQEENVIYLTNNYNFSKEDNVTHGGSHLLEVLIPFVKIKK